MKFPTLYAKSSTNKYKVWQIESFEDHYKVTHGFENCKMTTQIRPVTAKNIGKKNETTQEQQAQLEAQAKWQKQIDKKGYRENKEDIGVNDFYHPMKSDYFKDRKDNVVFPCYLQPKLNGLKTITPERNNDILYQSSGGKYYETLAHLDKEIKNIDKNLVLDGEIYLHGEDLQDISSAVKKKNKLTPKLQYIIYDIINDDIYSNRLKTIKNSIKEGEFVKICPTHEVNSFEEIEELFKYYVSLGYEGVMIKNKHGKYKPGPNRCIDNLKYKDFKDEEFEIVGYECDVHGRVIWICETKEGKTFKANPKGSHKKKEEWYKNGDKYIGKMLKVKFLEYSSSNIPQGNVVGLCIRESYE